MNRRRHGSKLRIALWMLIAAADVALLAATAGPLLLLLVTRRLTRRFDRRADTPRPHGAPRLIDYAAGLCRSTV